MPNTRNNRFQKGSGVFTCRTCKHNTRDTGGDNTDVRLCSLCWDLAGEENHILDTGGKTYDSAENVKALLAALDKQSGEGTAKAKFEEVCDAVGY